MRLLFNILTFQEHGQNLNTAESLITEKEWKNIFPTRKTELEQVTPKLLPKMEINILISESIYLIEPTKLN